MTRLTLNHKHHRPFVPPSWKTTDDRVRGGSSQSYLSPLADNGASFRGILDIKTLGGAGFASQFSPVNIDDEGSQGIKEGVSEKTTSDEVWDLSIYDGIEIDIGEGDGKVYTLILRDDKCPGKREDRREKAGINWEVEFEAQGDGGKVWKPWKDFKATYRGKEKEDVGRLRTEQVKRVGIMLRR